MEVRARLMHRALRPVPSPRIRLRFPASRRLLFDRPDGAWPPDTADHQRDHAMNTQDIVDRGGGRACRHPGQRTADRIAGPRHRRRRPLHQRAARLRGDDVACSADLAPLPPAQAFHRIGMKLLSTIGGASGPLIGSFFIAMGTRAGRLGRAGRQAVRRAPWRPASKPSRARGKADLGEKTMLDVLIPASRLLLRLADEGSDLDTAVRQAEAGGRMQHAGHARHDRDQGPRAFPR